MNVCNGLPVSLTPYHIQLASLFPLHLTTYNWPPCFPYTSPHTTGLPVSLTPYHIQLASLFPLHLTTYNSHTSFIKPPLQVNQWTPRCTTQDICIPKPGDTYGPIKFLKFSLILRNYQFLHTEKKWNSFSRFSLIFRMNKNPVSA